jgi:hypothetical protein
MGIEEYHVQVFRERQIGHSQNINGTGVDEVRPVLGRVNFTDLQAYITVSTGSG